MMMTREAAVYELKRRLPAKVSGTELYCHAYDLAIEALEKQIPKKPIEKIKVHPVYDENGTYVYVDADAPLHLHCPMCDEWIGMADNGCDAFCPKCGQAIDWEVE